MNVMTNAKSKLSQISGKVLDSKAYKTAERIAVGTSVGLMSIGASAINAFAADSSSGTVDLGSVVTASANVDNIMKNAEPFVEPAIIIMCGVAGLRLGMKFLRGSAK